MSFDARIKELGIELPAAPKPLGSYVPAVRTGSLVYLSGQLPLLDGKLIRTGVVGRDIDVQEANALALQCAINALSVLSEFLGGSLDSVKRCVKLSGYVASANDFTQQPQVINGASDLMAEVFGDSGKHARAAVGVNVLPINSPIEITFIFETQ
jgi:enamine deaminase RidA (YjgF/YER057c/UK114 family)